jgi:hypothetical protein
MNSSARLIGIFARTPWQTKDEHLHHFAKERVSGSSPLHNPAKKMISGCDKTI